MKPKEPPPLAHLFVSGQLHKDAEAHQRFIAACFALAGTIAGRLACPDVLDIDDIQSSVIRADALLKALKST